MQSAVVQTSSAKKMEKQILHSFVILWSPKSLSAFSLYFALFLTHHLPNLLRNCAPSGENKSKFPSAVEIFMLCYSMWDAGECTQGSKHGQNSLNVTVFLTRQFIHFPITGHGGVIITQTCHETVMSEPCDNVYWQGAFFTIDAKVWYLDWKNALY